MIITVEISYYPLVNDFSKPIDMFIEKLTNEKITVEIGKMSTTLSGEFNDVMKMLNSAMNEVMIDFPSIFNIKVSNSCPISL